MTRMVDTHEGEAARAWKKVGVIAALLLTAALAATPGNSQTTSPAAPEMVEDVFIVGLRSLTKDQVTAQLRTQKGQPYNPAFVQEDLARLGQMRTFKSPQVK